MHLRVGDALLELGLVSRDEIDSALEVQRETGERLGEILVGQGVISRLELAGALSEHWSSLTKLRGPGVAGEPDEAAPKSQVSAGGSRCCWWGRSRLWRSGWPAATGSSSLSSSGCRRGSMSLRRPQGRISWRGSSLLSSSGCRPGLRSLLGRQGRICWRGRSRLWRSGCRPDSMSLRRRQGRIAWRRRSRLWRSGWLAATGSSSARFERLSARFDELAAAAGSDQLAGEIAASVRAAVGPVR